MRTPLTLVAACCLAAALPRTYAHWCGTVINMPMVVQNMGTAVTTLAIGTDVTYEDALTASQLLAASGCYARIMLPVGGTARIHSGRCHHPFLHQYPGFADIDGTPAPAPMPSSQAASTRKMLQEGDGNVEDDTWYIKTVQRCKP
jgi:hypothetical protein